MEGLAASDRRDRFATTKTIATAASANAVRVPEILTPTFPEILAP